MLPDCNPQVLPLQLMPVSKYHFFRTFIFVLPLLHIFMPLGNWHDTQCTTNWNSVLREAWRRRWYEDRRRQYNNATIIDDDTRQCCQKCGLILFIGNWTQCAVAPEVASPEPYCTTTQVPFKLFVVWRIFCGLTRLLSLHTQYCCLGLWTSK